MNELTIVMSGPAFATTSEIGAQVKRAIAEYRNPPKRKRVRRPPCEHCGNSGFTVQKSPATHGYYLLRCDCPSGRRKGCGHA